MQEIKKLGTGDIELMRQMNGLFASAFNDRKTYRYDQPDDSYLRKLLGKENIIVLAAMQGGKVVGGLVAYVLDKLEQARSEIYIYDLAVSEDCRRQGIATRLIEDLKREAPVHGAWVIFVQADREDTPAVQLYEKLGVKEEPLHFDIEI